MDKVEITFLGSGDAFGSGGRMHTCFLVKSEEGTFLIDCGATSMISIRRQGIDPNEIQLILLSHLHGDHFGGIPFFLLDAQLISKRTQPLVIAGPPGSKERIKELMEAMFPGSSASRYKFQLDIIELSPELVEELEGISVIAYPVVHPSGSPSLALRVTCQGKVITYTGDTEWTESLIPAAQVADLLIAECYTYEKKVKYHLDYLTLIGNLPQLKPKKLILTHMSQDMLERIATLDCEVAEDGKTVIIA